MQKKNLLLTSLTVLTLTAFAGCATSPGSVIYHNNGVTNNMTVVGPVKIVDTNSTIAKGQNGVRIALIEVAKKQYGTTRVDNVVDIEESVANGRRIFSGIAVVYK